MNFQLIDLTVSISIKSWAFLMEVFCGNNWIFCFFYSQQNRNIGYRLLMSFPVECWCKSGLIDAQLNDIWPFQMMRDWICGILFLASADKIGLLITAIDRFWTSDDDNMIYVLGRFATSFLRDCWCAKIKNIKFISKIGQKYQWWISVFRKHFLY